MRAWDITVLIICFELALQVIIGCNLYSPNMHFYTPSQQPVSDVLGYTTGSMNSTTKLLDATKTPNADYFSVGMGLISAGNILIQILGSIVFFYPHLLSVFGIPPLIAVCIQCIIYLSYGIGIVQFASGRSTTLMS